MTAEPVPDPHIAEWRKYLTCCWLGGTPEERAFAFQRWNKLMRKDCRLAWQARDAADREAAVASLQGRRPSLRIKR